MGAVKERDKVGRVPAVEWKAVHGGTQIRATFVWWRISHLWNRAAALMTLNRLSVFERLLPFIKCKEK